MSFFDIEHPDITSACRTGYPSRTWDDGRYGDDYDGLGDYGVDIDALFEESRLAEWDRKRGDF